MVPDSMLPKRRNRATGLANSPSNSWKEDGMGSTKLLKYELSTIPYSQEEHEYKGDESEGGQLSTDVGALKPEY